MDMEYLLLLQQFRDTCGETFSTLAVHFSNLAYYLFNSVIFFFFWTFNKKYGKKILLAIYLSLSLLEFAKLIACVHRPWLLDTRIKPAAGAINKAPGYSFPSGHSAWAVSFAGMLGWLYRHIRWLFVLCIVYALLTMFSRNLIGVHTPQDVLVGCVFGIFGIWGGNRMVDWEEKGKNRDLIILAGVVLYCIISLSVISLKSYPLKYDAAGKLLADPNILKADLWETVGILMGVVIGLLLEKRFLNFSVSVSWPVRIARFVPGVLLYLFCGGAYMKIFINALGLYWGFFIGNILFYIFFIYLYPLIFVSIEKLCRHAFSDGKRSSAQSVETHTSR